MRARRNGARFWRTVALVSALLVFTCLLLALPAFAAGGRLLNTPTPTLQPGTGGVAGAPGTA